MANSDLSTEAGNAALYQSRDEFVNHLNYTPGIDPVLEVANGKPEIIPYKGWLMRAYIDAGYCGVVNVYTFDDGALVPTRIMDQRVRYGDVTVNFDLGPHDNHTLAVQPPNFPYKAKDPKRLTGGMTEWAPLTLDEDTVIDLANGGRVITNEPFDWRIRGINPSGKWIDMRRFEGGVVVPDFDIARIGISPEDLQNTLAYISLGIGLGMKDVATVVKTTEPFVARM